MWTEYGSAWLKGQQTEQQKPRNSVLHNSQRPLSNLCRTQAELKIQNPLGGNVTAIQPLVIPARLILCDLRETWIGLFTTQSLSLGTEVAFSMNSPQPFNCMTQVSSCVFRTDQSRVISKVQYDYRLSLKIIFKSVDEARLIELFINEMNSAQAAPMGIYNLEKRSA